MAYTFHELALGLPTIGATPETTQASAIGRITRASDPAYGDGEFIYMRAAGTIAIGAVCTYNKLVGTATPWTGTANSGAPLCVATVALTVGQYGWFYISGSAIVAISGTVAVGAPVYWQANGVVSTTAVAGKQVLGATAASVQGNPSAGFAIVEINRPCAQGAIS